MCLFNVGIFVCGCGLCRDLLIVVFAVFYCFEPPAAEGLRAEQVPGLGRHYLSNASYLSNTASVALCADSSGKDRQHSPKCSPPL